MLTLILQTQEGHQIELNVQPGDTFADLKRQYADHEVLGLSDSLEQLITNGASVPENTKIFDYVTGGAHEWFSTNAAEEPLSSRSADVRTKIRECCARGCSNTEATTPGKPFFPLPVDHDRLSVRLIEIGRPDLYDRIFGLDAKERHEYFLCESHTSQESSSLSLNSVVENPPNFSLLKSKSDRPKSNVREETNFTKKDEEKEGSNRNEVREDNVHNENSILELLDRVENLEHPGILCRLCGELAANPVRLYTKETENFGDEFSLADKINLCLPVTVTITDPLPKQICQDCHVKLNVCHDFGIASLRAADKLSMMLRENKFRASVNAEKRCPLCVEGDMRIVKKSGIYRREDSNNDFQEDNVFSRDNFEKSSPSDKVHLPVLDNHVKERKTSVLEARLLSDESKPLFSPNGQFSCSICLSSIVDFTAIKSHECQSKDRVSSRSCVICETADFTSSQELVAHYRRHGLRDNRNDDNNDDDENDDDDDDDRSNDELARTRQFDEKTLETIGRTTEIRCENCSKIFSSPETLKYHDCSHQSYDLTSTSDNFIVKSKLEDERTMETRQESKIPYNCHFCERKFTRKGSLEKHITVFHGGDPSKDHTARRCYKCKYCCEAFTREIDADTHASSKHLVAFSDPDVNSLKSKLFTEQLVVTCLYICEYCERGFTIPSSLHEHREAEHSRSLEFSCPVCGLTFESHRRLANHKNLTSHRKSLDDTGIRQLYVCKYCDKTFLHKSSNSAHGLIHREIPLPYQCRICNVYFSTYREIAEHRETTHPYQSTLHERSSRSYNCQYCRKEFVQEVALIKHIRVHTGERPYKCTICGKGFSQSSGLYTHLKIHSDLRPYSCTKCPRTFKLKGDRDNHVKRHAGNRPYECDFCKKTFMTQHVYSQHRKIHTDERPYKCDTCGQAFRRSYVLTVHMRRHTGEKPHVCDMCPKTYRQRGDLSKHRKVQHGLSNNSSRIFNATNLNDDSYDRRFGKTNEITESRGNSLMLLPL